MQVNIVVTDHEARVLMRDIISRVLNMTPVFRGGVRKHLQNIVAVNFRTQGGLSTPSPWAPLGSRALAVPNRIGMLRVTDRLYKSLTVSNHPDAVFAITPTEVVFGTRVPYAEKHQLGLGVPRRQPIPDPMPDTPGIVLGFANVFVRWILEGDSG